MSEQTPCQCFQCRCHAMAMQIRNEFPCQAVALVVIGSPAGNIASHVTDDAGADTLALAMKAAAIALEEKATQRRAEHTRRN